MESWLVRRMLVRATTKRYTTVIAEMIRQLPRGDRNLAGDLVEKYLAGLTTESGYWPDGDEVRGDMESLVRIPSGFT